MKQYLKDAKQFIHEIVALMPNPKMLRNYDKCLDLTDQLNKTGKYNVELKQGLTRLVFVANNFVVKIDYSYDNFYGDNKTEVNMYAKAKADGFDYLFAPATLYNYAGIDFEIMPKFDNIGYEAHRGYELEAFITIQESKYIYETCSDIHAKNFSYDYDAGVKIIDYAYNIFAKNFVKGAY